MTQSTIDELEDRIEALQEHVEFKSHLISKMKVENPENVGLQLPDLETKMKTLPEAQSICQLLFEMLLDSKRKVAESVESKYNLEKCLEMEIEVAQLRNASELQRAQFKEQLTIARAVCAIAFAARTSSKGTFHFRHKAGKVQELQLQQLQLLQKHLADIKDENKKLAKKCQLQQKTIENQETELENNKTHISWMEFELEDGFPKPVKTSKPVIEEQPRVKEVSELKDRNSKSSLRHLRKNKDKEKKRNLHEEACGGLSSPAQLSAVQKERRLAAIDRRRAAATSVAGQSSAKFGFVDIDEENLAPEEVPGKPEKGSIDRGSSNTSVFARLTDTKNFTGKFFAREAKQCNAKQAKGKGKGNQNRTEQSRTE